MDFQSFDEQIGFKAFQLIHTVKLCYMSDSFTIEKYGFKSKSVRKELWDKLSEREKLLYNKFGREYNGKWACLLIKSTKTFFNNKNAHVFDITKQNEHETIKIFEQQESYLKEILKKIKTPLDCVEVYQKFLTKKLTIDEFMLIENKYNALEGLSLEFSNDIFYKSISNKIRILKQHYKKANIIYHE